ncbi:MAG: cysteine synthase family protein [Chloroflexi bacterium]|nr:cysteine synthase family protein [Chloroflexota bacterium]
MVTIQDNSVHLKFAPGSLEAQVGNTPLLHLKHTAVAYHLPPTIQLYAKAEWFNPSGSVKDRAALHIIRTAEENGRLWPGMTLLDSTSGNMGIAYAMFAMRRGYKLKLALPENASVERIAILRQYGADLVFSDGNKGSNGALELARQMAAADPTLFYANQYDNPANWQAYYLSMAAEIWQQTEGQLTHFVAGVGSGGTFVGTARRLHELSATVTCTAVQPATAHEGIKGMKHMPTAIRPLIYDETVADVQTSITADEARTMMQILAQKEGVLVGPSAAAAVAAAVNIARNLPKGQIVTVLPDNGLKYLSNPF